MAQDGGCAENDDTNLQNGHRGATTRQRTLSGRHYKQWHFVFLSFSEKPTIVTRRGEGRVEVYM